MDAAGPLHPIVEDRSLPQAESSNPYDVGAYATENERIPGHSGQDTQNDQHGDSMSAAYFNDQDIPSINSYRLPYAIPGINVRVLDPVRRSSGSRTNDSVEAGRNDNERRSAFERPESTASHHQNSPNRFEHSWQSYSRRELRRRAMAISHPTPSSYGTTPLVFGPTRLGLNSLEQQPAGAVPAYRFMSQDDPPNIPARADTQPTPSEEGFLPSYPQAHSRPGTYLHFSPPAASPVINQQQHRRHHNQTQNPTVNTTVDGSQNTSPTHGQSNRQRARHVVEADQRRRSPRSFHSLVAATTSSPTSASGEYPQDLTVQQRADMARRLHIELLRDMTPDTTSAMDIYEQSFRHTRRYRPGTDEETILESMPPPFPSKGLDNQNDGRPEPKDSEELQVNLECKACMSQVVDTVLLPCGHAVLCRWCADQHMPSSRIDSTRPKANAICPVCRATVKQKVRIYLS